MIVSVARWAVAGDAGYDKRPGALAHGDNHFLLQPAAATGLRRAPALQAQALSYDAAAVWLRHLTWDRGASPGPCAGTCGELLHGRGRLGIVNINRREVQRKNVANNVDRVRFKGTMTKWPLEQHETCIKFKTEQTFRINFLYVFFIFIHYFIYWNDFSKNCYVTSLVLSMTFIWGFKPVLYQTGIQCNVPLFQNSHLSIEEFHSKLQEATNFPLRPFVIPFLKVGLIFMWE